MIHYDIDTTENDYNKLTGKVESLGELSKVLMKNGTIPDMVGYLSVEDMPDVSICICAEKELGFFIAITNNEAVYLSLGDEERLDEVVDIWGDELYISKGLFVPIHFAWKILEEYITSQKLSEVINWTTPDDVPEEGNYIQ